MISKHIFKLKIINRSEPHFWHTVKWLLLNVKTVLFKAIQFSRSTKSIDSKCCYTP